MSQTFRRLTSKIRVGTIEIGGDAPIAVQSMTNVFTHDIDRCVEQIEAMTARNCELVRLAVPTVKDTAALPEIAFSAGRSVAGLYARSPRTRAKTCNPIRAKALAADGQSSSCDSANFLTAAKLWSRSR